VHNWRLIYKDPENKTKEPHAGRLDLLDVLELVLLAGAIGVDLADVANGIRALVDLNLVLNLSGFSPPGRTVNPPDPECPSGDVEEAWDTNVVRLQLVSVARR
jgi:hypothetical protein